MSDHELVFEKGLLLLGLAYIKTAGLCYRFIVSQSKWCGKDLVLKVGSSMNSDQVTQVCISALKTSKDGNWTISPGSLA